MNRKNILILDPEQDMSALFARALEARKDCKCYWASREDEAVALSRDIPMDLALLDVSMAMNGSFSILKRLRALHPGMVIIVDAYLHQKPLVCRAMELGAAGSIIKPVKIDEFRKKIDSFLAPPTSPAS